MKHHIYYKIQPFLKGLCCCHVNAIILQITELLYILRVWNHECISTSYLIKCKIESRPVLRLCKFYYKIPFILEAWNWNSIIAILYHHYYRLAFITYLSTKIKKAFLLILSFVKHFSTCTHVCKMHVFQGTSGIRIFIVNAF